jgi:methionyl-tRNA formyltransferase
VKIVFAGTPEFAVPSLRAVLAAGHEVPLVLTQPDRPAGRGMELQQSPVKRLAEAAGLDVMQPEKIKHNVELRERLEAIAPDAIVVVAYGRIVPKWMLELPRFGNLNVHASLLPKYRGAAPIQWAVAHGERETGVAVMQLEEGLDTGPVFVERRVPIAPDAMASALFASLAEVGAEALLETLARLEAGPAVAAKQDDSLATLAPILTRDDGRMLLQERTAQMAYDRWRGFYPWPGAHTTFRGKRFLVHRMHVASSALELAANEVALRDGELVAGAAESSALVLDEVQMEGKPRMAGSQFARDFQVKAGERFE